MASSVWRFSAQICLVGLSFEVHLFGWAASALIDRHVVFGGGRCARAVKDQRRPLSLIRGQ